MYLTQIKQKIQYPKLFFLLSCIIFAYVFSRMHFFSEFAEQISWNAYILIFFAGFLFSYGFTAPFAVGFLVSLASQVDIFIAAPLAGIGAVLADFIIFRFICTSFSDEFEKLKLTYIFQKIRAIFDKRFSNSFKKYLLWTIAGFLIASPLPDEFGVSLISGFSNINQKIFSAFAFCLNTIGIFVVLSIA